MLFAPAMNIHMYENPILQENLRKLRRVGYHLLEPAEGFLACGYEAKAVCPIQRRSLEKSIDCLSPRIWLANGFYLRPGLIASRIDPVRYISNRSSGKMGYALDPGGAAPWRRSRLG